MVIFGAGVVTGGLLVGHADQLRFGRARQAAQEITWAAARAGQFPSPNGLKLELLRRAERELRLQPDQRERVDKILDASQARTRLLMEPVLPPLREELQRARDDFRAVLTAEQQKRFDELLKAPKLARDPREPRRPGLAPGRDRAPDAATYPPLSNEPSRR